ncbi:MAG: SLC13 family permease [Cellulosilyticaceae bacterium]
MGEIMDMVQLVAIVIFCSVMFFVVTEKIDKTIVAIGGGMLMVLVGILPSEKVTHYIDFNTIGVLIGMMIVVSVIRKTGLFEFVAIYTAKKTKGSGWKIMISFVIITAILSALLDNVTTVLLIGPMTIVITQILHINPMPFLITQIIASNIGGTATLVGDPPNIMIGSAANLGFNDFLLNSGPAALIVLLVTLPIIYFMYKDQIVVEKEYQNKIMVLDEKKTIKNKSLLIKSLCVMAIILMGFTFHDTLNISSAIVALTGAVMMLYIAKDDVEEILCHIEWPTIAFFLGLFIVVGGLEEVGVINILAEGILGITQGKPVMMMILLLWLSAIASSFLDNIPFVATLIPLILTLETQGIDVTPLWWAVSLGACFGGNGTLIGASANVVLANIGEKNGYKITFKNYMKIGFPLMILSIIISMVYLVLRYS